MGTQFASHAATRASRTPQGEPIPGRTDMVQNDAGGYVFKATDDARLRRFLILGTERGTYYTDERTHTLRSVAVLDRMISERPMDVLAAIGYVSFNGLAVSNTYALYALARLCAQAEGDARSAAYDALPMVARTGTHLFQFLHFSKGMRGWGSGLRRAVGRWYNRAPRDVAYQVLKYRQRDGWSQRDVLRLAHPTPATREHDALFQWVTKGERGEIPGGPAMELVDAFLAVQSARNAKEAARLVRKHRLTREMVPSEFLGTVPMWDALFEAMPIGAMVRNLGAMTAAGYLKPLSGPAREVAERLGDRDRIRSARLHPLALLVALKTYAQGHGMRGRNSWSPVGKIKDALDAAFYLSFEGFEGSGTRVLLALDVSGSMDQGAGNLPLSCREVAAAQAMVVARSEPEAEIMGFTKGFVPLPITAHMTLDQAVRVMARLPFDSTDCSVPFRYAQSNGWDVDSFCVLTDNETWYGDEHPVEALRNYRKASGIAARSAVVALTASEVTIADPEDPGMLDVCGSSTDTPRVLADYFAGRV